MILSVRYRFPEGARPWQALQWDGSNRAEFDPLDDVGVYAMLPHDGKLELSLPGWYEFMDIGDWLLIRDGDFRIVDARDFERNLEVVQCF